MKKLLLIAILTLGFGSFHAVAADSETPVAASDCNGPRESGKTIKTGEEETKTKGSTATQEEAKK